jgi:hypothetical protein
MKILFVFLIVVVHVLFFSECAGSGRPCYVDAD